MLPPSQKAQFGSLDEKAKSWQMRSFFCALTILNKKICAPTKSTLVLKQRNNTKGKIELQNSWQIFIFQNAPCTYSL
jgi:hypothetical protein